MKILDLTEETRMDYFTCLEEWSDEIKDGVCRKECWYKNMQEKGLRVKLARNDAGIVAGMIQYAPIEHSWIEGEDLYFVYCIWVHGHKKGRGDLRKQGYRKVDRKGISVLLWKTFTEETRSPRWIRAKKKPEQIPGKVAVTALSHGWCSGINGMIERAKKICSELGDKVVFREIDMTSRETVREWGLSDGLFVDDKNIYKRPPLTYDKIRETIEKRVRKL